jgi:hypothetical protein
MGQKKFRSQIISGLSPFPALRTCLRAALLRFPGQGMHPRCRIAAILVELSSAEVARIELVVGDGAPYSGSLWPCALARYGATLLDITKPHLLAKLRSNVANDCEAS